MCVWIKLKRENPNLGCIDWVFSEIPAPPIMKYISAPISGITFSFEFSVPKWVPTLEGASSIISLCAIGNSSKYKIMRLIGMSVGKSSAQFFLSKNEHRKQKKAKEIFSLVINYHYECTKIN